MKCDIIIPVWNQPEHTCVCIDSIVKNTRYPHRIIVIDNGSSSGTKSYLEGLKAKIPDLKLIRNNENLGFVKAVNQGLDQADAPYVCLLNNDTVPAPGWLERLIEFAEDNRDVGLLNPVCNGHLDTPIEEYAKRLKANKGRYMEMNQCFGFCMLIKREVIDRIGVMDEAFGIGGFDDTDYSMRAYKAGYRSVCVHSSYVYHKEHTSFKAMGDRKKLVSPGEEAYFKKWPRHLRVGLAFTIDADVEDAAVKNMLRGVLFLAREWCWLNVWIFGEKESSGNKIREMSKKIKMPLHQNIKLNYFKKGSESLQVAIKLIERSFGTKRRKKYDAVLVDNNRLEGLLKGIRLLHWTDIYRFDFKSDFTGQLKDMVKDIHYKQRKK